MSRRSLWRARSSPRLSAKALDGRDAVVADFVHRRAAARATHQVLATRRGAAAVSAAFVIFVFLSVSLVHLSVGSVPVRALYGVALMGLLAVAFRDQTSLALRKQRNTLLVIAGFAVLGSAVSVLASAQPALVLRQLLEIHAQAAVNLIIAAAVLEICGARAMAMTFLGVIGLSMALAVIQASGFEPAWTLREALGPIQNPIGLGRGRAPGLSLNSILLGTQTCLAIAMLYMYQRQDRASRYPQIHPSILLLCAAALAVAVATGTRSPILGIVIFLAIYMTRRLGAWAVVAALLVLAAAPLALSLLAHLQGSGVRALQTEDKSAIGRWPLILYGLRLFSSNPLGYGFGFIPSEHWAEHWTALSHVKNAGVIKSLELHNYFLNTLNKYGSAMLLILPAVGVLIRRHSYALLGFAPYILHIFFHNDGPLDTDYMIWFVVAMSSACIGGPRATDQSFRSAELANRPLARGALAASSKRQRSA